METATAEIQSRARDIADEHFNFASDFLRLPASTRAFVKTPFRVLQVTLPITMDDGLLQLFAGYRIQHNDLHTPMVGGVRYHPAVDEAELCALAETMTWKASLVRVPMGGAMGGVRCDPRLLSKSELRRITQKYIARVHHLMGPHADIFTPDMNTNSEVMAWILNEYCDRHGHTFACVTGKPGYLGGLMDPHLAACRGATIVLSRYVEDLGFTLKGMKIAIQGFGCMGSNLALMLAGRGCQITAVSDVYSGIVCRGRGGLSVPDVIRHVQDTGSVADYPSADSIERDAVLSLGCDILVLAGMENAVTEENAEQIKARIVVEAANLPSTYEASELLHRKGITVLPDILVNAGGIISSYFEWKQNLGAEIRQDDNLDPELSNRLLRAYAEVRQRAAAERLPMKKAAYVIALERIAAEEAKQGY